MKWYPTEEVLAALVTVTVASPDVAVLSVLDPLVWVPTLACASDPEPLATADVLRLEETRPPVESMTMVLTDPEIVNVTVESPLSVFENADSVPLEVPDALDAALPAPVCAARVPVDVIVVVNPLEVLVTIVVYVVAPCVKTPAPVAVETDDPPLALVPVEAFVALPAPLTELAAALARVDVNVFVRVDVRVLVPDPDPLKVVVLVLVVVEVNAVLVWFAAIDKELLVPELPTVAVPVVVYVDVNVDPELVYVDVIVDVYVLVLVAP
ncbi:hypothetical protein GGR54DRAFT_643114 [Hypoxylon sp. NC1633]|nr:hypothetical protein GGR54DRAFT_643114 [Hypoxylon sp. NC1633]